MTQTISTVAVTAILACWSGGAFGADPAIPKQYHGTWCPIDPTGGEMAFFRRCRDKGEPETMFIEARGTLLREDAVSCKLKTIAQDKTDDYRLQLECLGEGHGGVADLVTERWKLLDGGRKLRITWQGP